MTSKKTRNKIILLGLLAILIITPVTYFYFSDMNREQSTVDSEEIFNEENDNEDENKIEDVDTDILVDSIPEESEFMLSADPINHSQNEAFSELLRDNIEIPFAGISIEESESPSEDIRLYQNEFQGLINFHLSYEEIDASIDLQTIDQTIVYGDWPEQDIDEMTIPSLTESEIALAFSGGIKADEFEELIYNVEDASPDGFIPTNQGIRDSNINTDEYNGEMVYDISIETQSGFMNIHAVSIDEYHHIIGSEKYIKKTIDTHSGDNNSFDSEGQVWNQDNLYYSLESNDLTGRDIVNTVDKQVSSIVFDHRINNDTITYYSEIEFEDNIENLTQEESQQVFRENIIFYTEEMDASIVQSQNKLQLHGDMETFPSSVAQQFFPQFFTESEEDIELIG